MIRALRRLLHQHWPANPTCRSGIVREDCRCGKARYVHLVRGMALWSTPWTDSAACRAQLLARYSHEGIAR